MSSYLRLPIILIDYRSIVCPKIGTNVLTILSRQQSSLQTENQLSRHDLVRALSVRTFMDAIYKFKLHLKNIHIPTTSIDACKDNLQQYGGGGRGDRETRWELGVLACRSIELSS